MTARERLGKIRQTRFNDFDDRLVSDGALRAREMARG